MVHLKPMYCEGAGFTVSGVQGLRSGWLAMNPFVGGQGWGEGQSSHLDVGNDVPFNLHLGVRDESFFSIVTPRHNFLPYRLHMTLALPFVVDWVISSPACTEDTHFAAIQLAADTFTRKVAARTRSPSDRDQRMSMPEDS
jgi:hypothetical protein